MGLETYTEHSAKHGRCKFCEEPLPKVSNGLYHMRCFKKQEEPRIARPTKKERAIHNLVMGLQRRPTIIMNGMRG